MNGTARDGEFAARGFAVVPRVFDEASCDSIATRLSGLETAAAGSRRVLEQQWCADLARRLRAHESISPLLPEDAVAVQCTFFAKTPTRNWLVALHQDLSIPVRERVASEQCSGWSEKEGALFVQPPADVLGRLTAVRVHVDDCPADSGALRIVPGSHTLGRLEPHDAETIRDERGEQLVTVGRGGVLVLRPLLLHSSSKAARPQERRVLHFLFGPRQLPLGLMWQHAI
jgi:hypothetical protein